MCVNDPGGTIKIENATIGAIRAKNSGIRRRNTLYDNSVKINLLKFVKLRICLRSKHQRSSIGVQLGLINFLSLFKTTGVISGVTQHYRKIVYGASKRSLSSSRKRPVHIERFKELVVTISSLGRRHSSLRIKTKPLRHVISWLNIWILLTKRNKVIPNISKRSNLTCAASRLYVAVNKPLRRFAFQNFPTRSTNIVIRSPSIWLCGVKLLTSQINFTRSASHFRYVINTKILKVCWIGIKHNSIDNILNLTRRWRATKILSQPLNSNLPSSRLIPSSIKFLSLLPDLIHAPNNGTPIIRRSTNLPRTTSNSR